VALYSVVRELFEAYPFNQEPSFQHLPQMYREKMDERGKAKTNFERCTRVKFVEVRAAAFIIVALKYLLGLNDHLEHQFSLVAKEFREAALAEDDPSPNTQREPSGYRQPGLLYSPRNFAQSSNFLEKKKRNFGTKVTFEAFLSISQILKVTRLQGGTQTKLRTC
jgi:hypothetical protein